MSAVRMVAYGVLELKRVDPPAFKDSGSERFERFKEEMFEFDQLMKLVKDELKREGFWLAPKISNHRSATTPYVLYGALSGHPTFPLREFLHEGSFKECCVVAARLLDDGENPPTADGLVFSGNPQG